MTSFEAAIERLLSVEGGYVNDPEDPGGETNWGISKHEYPNEDIKNLTREQAVAIYRRDFWEKINGDDLPLLVADQLLDFAVNAGVQTAIRAGQKAIGAADDGHWGPVTQATILGMPGGIFTARFAAEKIRHYTKLKGFVHDGAGWMNRIAIDLDFAAEDMS